MSSVGTWWSGLSDMKKVAVVSAVAVLLAAIITGTLGLWSGVFSDNRRATSATSSATPSSSARYDDSPSPSPDGTLPVCGNGPGNDVSIEPKELAVASTGTLTANVKCRLEPGWHLVWIVRLDGVGTPVPHPNYYQKDDLEGPGKWTYEVNLSKAEPGSTRNMYVVLMNDSAYAQMSENRNKDGSLLKLPNGARKVSNTVPVERYGSS